MKRLFLLILFFMTLTVLQAESFFAFGLGVTEYNVVLKNTVDSSYDYTINIYPAISCTYINGNKWALYVNANFQYLATLYRINKGKNPDIYEVGLGLRNNIAADLTVGGGYIFRFREDNFKLFLGGGIHTAMPHIPYDDDGDANTDDILILGFNIGVSGKVLFQIQYLYVSVDVVYDFALFSSKFADTRFTGIAVTPAIGFIYHY